MVPSRRWDFPRNFPNRLEPAVSGAFRVDEGAGIGESYLDTAAATVRAYPNVLFKDTLDELGPADSAGHGSGLIVGGSGWRLAGGLVLDRLMSRGLVGRDRWRRQALAVRRRRGKDAAVPELVGAWWWDEARQPSQEVGGLKGQVGDASRFGPPPLPTSNIEN